MSIRATWARRFNRLITINHPDPTLARRGRLLNILLLGFGGGMVIAGCYVLASLIFTGAVEDTLSLLGVLILSSALFIAIFFINRRYSPRLAAILLLLGLLTVLAFADEAPYVVSGRSTLYFVLPIIVASVILSPAASYPIAALAVLELYIMSLVNGLPTESLIFIGIGFFLVALVSWLAANSLEQALAELRVVNRELDRRVAERTQDLADALIRVQLESSKNQAILESIADGVIVFDGEGRAVVANPAIVSLFNWSPTGFLGLKIDNLMAGLVSATDQTAMLRQLHSSDSSGQLSTLRLQWGNKTLSASFAPIHIEQEVGQGTVAVFRDITHEAELDRMKSIFVSMVSHELRTPLGSIMGYSEMLREQVYGPLTDKQLGVINRLVANCKRLLSLVNDLLDRARLEAGQLKLNPAVVQPAQLCEELLAIALPMAKAKNLTLTAELADDLPAELVADFQRLLQVLLNLVGNAIKFTEQGSISVRCYRPDETHWALRVTDTGSGIPPDDQPHIFDMFRQVDSSATRKHSGAGLGLSIVKQLVTLMSGSITLSSAIGHGSTFEVRLPLVLALEEEHV